MYVTAPVKGIIGAGTVTEKYWDWQNLIWNEEIKMSKVI